ncbi:MAG TPA: MBL fold metallo-hydrolase, partial [Acidimicrobiia bacterium]
YLVFDESDKVAMLVDAPPDPDRIGQVALDLGVSIGAVLLTHGHIDHIGGSGQIAKRFDSQVFVHPDDDFLTLHPVEQATRMFGFLPPGSYEVPDEISALEDGQNLDLAGFSVEVRQTPGHTPGHCCFYLAEQETLFSGDQLFAGSVGRTDLPGGSTAALLESMAARVLTLDDQVRVLPGHGDETTIGWERTTNPFLQNL